MSPDPIHAGWASADITPDLPCWMGGYADRTAPANGIHDPLVANALALGDPLSPLVIVVCDLVSVTMEMTHEVRRRVSSGIPGASEATVWLGATHTHSGPDVSHLLSDRDPSPHVVERVLAGATQAARDAVTGMRPVHATWASGLVEGVATNRDHPGTGEEIALDLLCMYATGVPRSAPAAVFGSFPCHPTVLGADNLALSADLPGAFRRHVRGLIGDTTWVALATGAAGDISTRHVRRGQGFEELERLGHALAVQTQRLIGEAQPITLAPGVMREAAITLHRKVIPDVASLRAAALRLEEEHRAALQAGNLAQARTLQTTIQGIRGARRLEALHGDIAAQVTIMTARLGALGLVAIPGEPYNELGAALRHSSDLAVLVLGYTNGYIGYIPTRQAYQAMDYEVLMSPFAPGTGERIVAQARGLLGVDKELTS